MVPVKEMRMALPASSKIFRDRDLIAHELLTFVIGAGIGTVLHARDCEEARVSLLVITAVIACGIMSKSMIYSGVINFNAGKRRRKWTHHAVTTQVIQELAMAIPSMLVGCYCGPILKSFWLRERFDYPQPGWAILVILLCVLIKFILYTKVVTVGTPTKMILYTPQALSIFFARHNWRRFVQLSTTVVLGLLLGLYLYQSRIIFKPAAWWPSRYAEVYEQPTAIISFISSNAIKDEYMVKSFSALWEDPQIQPYLKAGLVLALFCLLLKFIMYVLQPEPTPRREIPANAGHSSSSTQRNPLGAKLATERRSGGPGASAGPTTVARASSGRSAPAPKPSGASPKTTSGRTTGGAKSPLGSVTAAHKFAPMNRGTAVLKTSQRPSSSPSRSGQDNLYARPVRNAIFPLPPTQEHRVDRPKAPVIARTEERPVGKPEGYEFGNRLAHTLSSLPRTMKNRDLWRHWMWDGLHFSCGCGGGLLLIPTTKNAFLHQTALYPYGWLWLVAVVGSGIVCVLYNTYWWENER